MVFLWRTGAISGTGKFPSAHQLRPSRSFLRSVNSSYTLSHQSKKSRSSLFLVFLVRLYMKYCVVLAYAKNFPVHILCVTILRCWAADHFTGKFIEMLHSKLFKKCFSLHKDLLLFKHGFYSFVLIVLINQFLGMPHAIQIHRSSQ